MTSSLPMHKRPIESVPGHWLLARLGKRVLRPGGLELTTTMLRQAALRQKDVVEFAPGIGKTAKLILDEHPASYVGVDQDPQAVALTAEVVGQRGHVTEAKASETGLPSASADVVIGEAMLTMQGAKMKKAIVAEAYRILRPGGVYCIHELSLRPDSLDASVKAEVSKELAKTIHVNARPLTQSEWTEVLESEGFQVRSVDHANMELLGVRRNLADEGLRGTAKIVWNLLRIPGARARVMSMRKVFRRYSNELGAIALVAVKL